MITFSARRLVEFFSVPALDDNADLIKAQFEVFTKQLPLMYAVLLINAWILVYTYWGHAPTWLIVHVPVFFTLACGARLVGWWRSRHRHPSAERARATLLRTNRLAWVISIFLVGWALALYPYGDYGMQGNVVFFMAITGICVVVCMMHLRSAAFTVWIVISLAFFCHFIASGVPSFVAMAINMPFVSAALLSMVYVHEKTFSNSVRAKKNIEAMSRENYRLANVDSLTGLSNRRRFFSQLAEAVSDADFRGQRIAVGIVDLDGFKPVNDLYGHALGDKLLVEVGRRLTLVAGGMAKVARLGGDEFALLVDTEFDDRELLDLGERVCAALGDQFVISDTSVQISASAGFAIYPDAAECKRTLYERADYALYDSKRRHRGHAVLFSEEQIAEIDHSQKVEALLRTASLRDEMLLYFQPIVDVASGRTVAFEALARWHSPALGSVPPSVFIPIAERTGRISELTQVLLQKATAAAAKWPAHVRLSFNLSNHDIGSPNGVDQIIRIIRASGIDPTRIDLEITETAVMADLAHARTAIERMKALGCGIALDDFGTGFSSLSQLHELPLTKIKIDRSFVTGLDGNPASYKIVKSLLTLSRDMGLYCVTEGVETSAEKSVVEALGGRQIQGYFYSRPLTEADALAFLGPDGPEASLLAQIA